MAFPTKEEMSQKAEAAREAFSSWDSFKKAIQVRDTLGEGQTVYQNAGSRWINEGNCRASNLL